MYASIQEEKQWQAFKQQHDCKIIGKKKGQTSTGVAPMIGGHKLEELASLLWKHQTR